MRLRGKRHRHRDGSPTAPRTTTSSVYTPAAGLRRARPLRCWPTRCQGPAAGPRRPCSAARPPRPSVARVHDPRRTSTPVRQPSRPAAGSIAVLHRVAVASGSPVAPDGDRSRLPVQPECGPEAKTITAGVSSPAVGSELHAVLGHHRCHGSPPNRGAVQTRTPPENVHGHGSGRATRGHQHARTRWLTRSAWASMVLDRPTAPGSARSAPFGFVGSLRLSTPGHASTAPRRRRSTNGVTITDTRPGSTGWTASAQDVGLHRT